MRASRFPDLRQGRGPKTRDEVIADRRRSPATFRSGRRPLWRISGPGRSRSGARRALRRARRRSPDRESASVRSLLGGSGGRPRRRSVLLGWWPRRGPSKRGGPGPSPPISGLPAIAMAAPAGRARPARFGFGDEDEGLGQIDSSGHRYRGAFRRRKERPHAPSRSGLASHRAASRVRAAREAWRWRET